MVRSTTIFRVHDGLPLAASVDDETVSALRLDEKRRRRRAWKVMGMREMWVASVEGQCDETGVIERLWAAETNHDANDDTGPSSQPASGDESSDDASGDVRLAEPAVILDRAATSQLARSHFSWRATAATPRPRRLSRSSLAVIPRPLLGTPASWVPVPQPSL